MPSIVPAQCYTAKPLFGSTRPLATASAAALGGSPVWDHRMNRLSWVDTLSCTLYQYDATTNAVDAFHWDRAASDAAFGPSDGDASAQQPDDVLSFAIPCAEDADVYVCGSARGIFLWTPTNNVKTHHQKHHRHGGAAIAGAVTPSAVVLHRLPCATPQDARVRINDACVDPHGRLFYGTMDVQEKLPIGSVSCYDLATPASAAGGGTSDGAAAVHGKQPSALPLCGPFTVSHGIDWSPAFDAMYVADRRTRSVFRVAYDTICGVGRTASDAIKSSNMVSLASPRDVVFTVQDNASCSPGGLCVDEAGRLWVAVWGGEQVLCIDPETRSVLAEVAVPGGSCVTNVCFGGPKLSRLFVTTAARPPGRRAASPQENGTSTEVTLAGQVFVADVGVCGLPFHPFPLPLTNNSTPTIASKL